MNEKVKKIKERILKEAQHNLTTTLEEIKTENRNFDWSTISYEKTGDTILHIAAQRNYLSLIDYLLNNDKEFTLNPSSSSSVNVKNKDDKTPLHDAAQFGQLEAVVKLCSYGANINALKRGDWTPLMLACTKIQVNNLKIVKILVENGAKLNVINKDGWTCVHLLAREGGHEIYDYLENNGLNVNTKTKNGRTALHIAALHGHKIIVEKLLLKNLNIEVRDGCGNTPLHEAILGGHIEIAELLIEHGADILAKNNTDFSILHLAASQPNLEIVNYIINNLNVDINLQNKQGWTAAHCAARKKFQKTYQYLEKCGSDLNRMDNFGRAPSDYLIS